MHRLDGGGRALDSLVCILKSCSRLSSLLSSGIYYPSRRAVVLSQKGFLFFKISKHNIQKIKFIFCTARERGVIKTGVGFTTHCLPHLSRLLKGRDCLFSLEFPMPRRVLAHRMNGDVHVRKRRQSKDIQEKGKSGARGQVTGA